MMFFSMNKHTPMWAGWNSLATKDDLPLQKIGCIKKILIFLQHGLVLLQKHCASHRKLQGNVEKIYL